MLFITYFIVRSTVDGQIVLSLPVIKILTWRSFFTYLLELHIADPF